MLCNFPSTSLKHAPKAKPEANQKPSPMPKLLLGTSCELCSFLGAPEPVILAGRWCQLLMTWALQWEAL
ncbi:hypothetical protein GCM10007338_14900 [Corynebacterium pelargi]|nr:hypothetical protein GCM10007338_14900 [Corynebacterium pelargi]